jgi:hypothetical protein
VLVGDEATRAADALALADPWAFGADMEVLVSAGAPGPPPRAPPGAPPSRVQAWERSLPLELEGFGLSLVDSASAEEVFYARL